MNQKQNARGQNSKMPASMLPKQFALLAFAAFFVPATIFAQPAIGIKGDPLRTTPTQTPSSSVNTALKAGPPPQKSGVNPVAKNESNESPSDAVASIYVREVSSGGCDKAADAVWLGYRNVHQSRTIRIIYEVKESVSGKTNIRQDNVLLLPGDEATVLCGYKTTNISPSNPQLGQLALVRAIFRD